MRKIWGGPLAQELRDALRIAWSHSFSCREEPCRVWFQSNREPGRDCSKMASPTTSQRAHRSVDNKCRGKARNAAGELRDAVVLR